MPKFVLMTRLSPEAVHDAKVRRAMGREWLNKVKAACPEVKWLAHYAILGPYDFMDVYEAPTVETAHKVSLISRAEGAVSAESWQALPYEEFLGLLEEVEP
ncbi:MAG: GYD domain-containing protein [Thermoanaerobaculales bacterium]|nr:GYD domain-containing protein [Thermoanaerobaculales bacterium]